MRMETGAKTKGSVRAMVSQAGTRTRAITRDERSRVPSRHREIVVKSGRSEKNIQSSDLIELRVLAARYGLPIEHLVGRITLRSREIAAALGVGLRTVEHWIATGKLPSVQVERIVIVPIHDLLRFLEENRRITRSHHAPSLAQRACALLDGEAK